MGVFFLNFRFSACVSRYSRACFFFRTFPHHKFDTCWLFLPCFFTLTKNNDVRTSVEPPAETTTTSKTMCIRRREDPCFTLWLSFLFGHNVTLSLNKLYRKVYLKPFQAQKTKRKQHLSHFQRDVCDNSGTRALVFGDSLIVASFSISV